jgi:sporulation protein YlmC with PRC-barrel domain
MLRSFKALRGIAIRATDGQAGTLSDVYFDDSNWRVRHCVIDTGRWLADRYVLVSPRSLSIVDTTRRELWVRLSKSEVMRRRSAKTDRPVSRQKRRLTFYHDDSRIHDRHLRSCTAVLGHRLEATDGRLGRVDDFMIDDKAWMISELVVDANQWNTAVHTRVAVTPQHVEGISWPEARVSLDLSRADVVTTETQK